VNVPNGNSVAVCEPFCANSPGIQQVKKNINVSNK